MTIKLKKALAFFDIEATGLNTVTDRICQLCIIKLLPDGSRESWENLINPGMPMPMAMDKWFPVLGTAIPLLIEECQRAGRELNMHGRAIIDPCQIFRRKESRTLSKAVSFYCGRELEGAHDAMVDTKATVDVFEGQLQMYADMPHDIAEISDMFMPFDPSRNVDWKGLLCYDENDQLMINFGRYRNQLLDKIVQKDPGYLKKLLMADFPLKVKEKIRERLES